MPITRIVCGLTARNGLPSSVSPMSVSFHFWICDEIAKARKLSRIQASGGDRDPLEDSGARAGVSAPAPGVGSASSRPPSGRPDPPSASTFSRSSARSGLRNAAARARAVDLVVGALRAAPPLGCLGIGHSAINTAWPRHSACNRSRGARSASTSAGRRCWSGSSTRRRDVLHRSTATASAELPRSSSTRSSASSRRAMAAAPRRRGGRPRHPVHDRPRARAWRSSAVNLPIADVPDPRPDARAARPAGLHRQRRQRRRARRAPLRRRPRRPERASC